MDACQYGDPLDSRYLDLALVLAKVVGPFFQFDTHGVLCGYTIWVEIDA